MFHNHIAIDVPFSYVWSPCPVKMKRVLQILNNGTPALEGILFYYEASQKYIQQVFHVQQVFHIQQSKKYRVRTMVLRGQLTISHYDPKATKMRLL